MSVYIYGLEPGLGKVPSGTVTHTAGRECEDRSMSCTQHPEVKKDRKEIDYLTASLNLAVAVSLLCPRKETQARDRGVGRMRPGQELVSHGAKLLTIVPTQT